ncbi:hypothetical protein SHKM778_33800 [Streptomyces sp. KM77-8]|uniref:Uncharacterized protein n=1 Tax=Streptomyces haneummycinicus TaxID=3074435 RepID=A0AAT9HI57_9ACTN
MRERRPSARRAADVLSPPRGAGTGSFPCVTFDWNRRVAENHAYRDRISITAEQREAAAPRAKALTAVLGEPADDGLDAAVAEALGVRPERIELRRQGYGVPAHGVLVGGGEGRVCVNGEVDGAGHVEVEIVGRTLEGTCLPGEGGH